MYIKQLKKICNQQRKYIFDIVCKRGGHLSTAFSSIEIVVTLYFTDLLNINKNNFKNKNRNIFLLSKGHGETLLYSILVKKNIIKEHLLQHHYRNGMNKLGGHIDISTPGVEMTSGALGHGLSLGAGIALGKKKNSSKKNVFVLLGDAECSEGSVWEAAISAKKNNLDNLIAIIDDNKIGATNFTKNFSSVHPIDKKFTSFGWETKKCNGHDIESIYKILKKFKESKNLKPKALICNTIKGKGLSFLENDPTWHSRELTSVEKKLGNMELEQKFIKN